MTKRHFALTAVAKWCNNAAAWWALNGAARGGCEAPTGHFHNFSYEFFLTPTLLLRLGFLRRRAKADDPMPIAFGYACRRPLCGFYLTFGAGMVAGVLGDLFAFVQM
jgi:hypothetical protein